MVNLDPGGSLCVASRKDWSDWWFVPHVHGLTAGLREMLLAEVDAELECPDGRSECLECIRSMLQDRTARRRLRNAYTRCGLDDANAISMSLYLGPRGPGRSILATSGAAANAARAGWLLTGDAALADERRRESWLGFCHGIGTEHVAGTLMLPHHGAGGRYWSSAILQAAPGARLYATADENDARRPHATVRDALGRISPKLADEVIKVSEVPERRLRDVSGPPDANPVCTDRWV
jgi:hypothetical protein